MFGGDEPEIYRSSSVFDIQYDPAYPFYNNSGPASDACGFDDMRIESFID
jgi:hypothetical protein